MAFRETWKGLPREHKAEAAADLRERLRVERRTIAGRITAVGRSSRQVDRPSPIVAGEVFDLEVAGEKKVARMKRRQRVDGVEEWSTAQGYPLREGLRVGFLGRRGWYALPPR